MMRPVSLLIFVQAQPVFGVDRVILARRHQVLDTARRAGRRIAQIAPRPRQLPFKALAQMRWNLVVIPDKGKFDKTPLILLPPLLFPDSQTLSQCGALLGLLPPDVILASDGRLAD